MSKQVTHRQYGAYLTKIPQWYFITHINLENAIGVSKKGTSRQKRN